MLFLLRSLAAIALVAAAATVTVPSAQALDTTAPAPKGSLYFEPSIYFPGLEQGAVQYSRRDGTKAYKILVTPNTLGEYIVKLYKFFTGATAIVAMFMVTYGGLLWLLAGGNQGSISNAKEIITGAIAGMVIALLTYALLATISRGLVTFKSLDTRLEFKALNPAAGTLPPDVTCDSSGISSLSDVTRLNVAVNAMTEEGSLSCLNGEAIEGLIEAGYTMTRNPPPTSQILITSALRLNSFQAELFIRNCVDSACKDQHPDDWLQQCVRTCRVPTCNPYNGPCPHSMGNAVDAFCNNGQRYGDCQLKLERAMLAEGFCRLNSEQWHFEKPSTRVGDTCRVDSPNDDGSRPGCPDCCNSKTGEHCPS